VLLQSASVVDVAEGNFTAGAGQGELHTDALPVPTIANGAILVHPSNETHLVVPVPLYSHEKPKCIGANGSNPLLGSIFEPRCGANGTARPVKQHTPTKHEEEHGVAYTAILLLFLLLTIGVAIAHVLERLLPFVPFTAAMFITGFLLAAAQAYKRDYGLVVYPTYDTAIYLFEDADPHLMLYIFLPPLVFGEALNLNTSMVKKCFSQCVLLAGPGVLIGTALTALFAVYILPYGWDWNTAMLFGSILSATDPVAVVAIFGAVGVSPRLTMVISGESLFNDGTAIVLFTLYMDLCGGARPTFVDFIQFLFQMMTWGPIMGMIMGYVVVWFIGLSSEQQYDSDCMGQVVITICCAYLCFFMAEEIGSSGVLTLVATGYVVGTHAWPRFISRETMHTVWHAIEFMGNTVIFALAGIIFGGIVYNHQSVITWRDYLLVLVTYAFSTIIRAVMIGTLYIPLRYMGQLSPQEGVVMVWSGMRGAVGLLMAVAADRSPYISEETGTRIMFHMGGLAAMMLLVNGPLTPLVLRMCGLMEHQNKHKELKRLEGRIQEQTMEQLREDLSSAESQHLFSGAAEKEVVHMVRPAQDLDTSEASEEEVRMGHTLSTGGRLASKEGKDGFRKAWMRTLRESLLRVVKNIYWELLDNGVLPRKSTCTKVLLDSADLAMMESNRPVAESESSSSKTGLIDWEIVRVQLRLGAFENDLDYKRNCPIMAQLMSGDFDHYQQRCIVAALAFMHAHENALRIVLSFKSPSESETVEEQILVREVEKQNAQAAIYISSMPPETVRVVRTKILATKLLQYEAGQVTLLRDRGLIQNTIASELEHKMHASSHNVNALGMKEATDILATPIGATVKVVGSAVTTTARIFDILAARVPSNDR
jgi:NhaP-type Na+/H+ or K+/H+ antiporter